MSLPGLARPMRAAGFALLGVAVIAAAIGTASAVSGDRPAQDTAAPTEQPVPQPDDQTPDPPSPTEPEVPPTDGDDERDNDENGLNGDEPDNGNGVDRGPADPESEARPPAERDPARPGDRGPVDAVKSEPVRVYNNSTIPNHAARAADDLRAAGWNVVSVSNYSDGIIYTTTVYYRPGTSEERAAQVLGEEFGIRVEPRFDGIKDASSGLIVIVTKDYEGIDGAKS